MVYYLKPYIFFINFELVLLMAPFYYEKAEISFLYIEYFYPSLISSYTIHLRIKS